MRLKDLFKYFYLLSMITDFLLQYNIYFILNIMKRDYVYGYKTLIVRVFMK